MYAKVIIDVSHSEVDKIFDYHCNDDVKKGHRVMVPFGNRIIEGYVTDIAQSSDYPKEKIKNVHSILDPHPVISEEMLQLATLMTGKYNINMVDALRLFIPSQMRGGRVKELKRTFAALSPKYVNIPTDSFVKKGAAAQYELVEYLRTIEGEFTTNLNKEFSASALRNLTQRGIVITTEVALKREPYKRLKLAAESDVTLTNAQSNAIKAITSKILINANLKENSINNNNNDTENFINNNNNYTENSTNTSNSDIENYLNHEQNNTFLLHGVTGSGKTMVYIECIKHALDSGKSAIMLVPEISLTPQVFSIFKSAFGKRIAILHSGLSAGERFDEWQRMLLGEADVAIGARSAIFAPVKNVGIIIIDEEHDSSYSSESYPRYETHDIAMFRSRYNNCPLVLGSATPSVESYYKAQKGSYALLEMDKRINNIMPSISIINMCREYLAGNQIFSYRLCKELEKVLSLGQQAMLFLNRRGYSSFIRCSSCGYVPSCENCDVSLVYHKDEETLKCHYCASRYTVPAKCPKCQSDSFRRGFVGTQQIVEKLLEFFPKARVLRMDNDTTQNKDAHFEILEKFKSRQADILVGTQMISKGHDFPFVTLVGILDADMSLHYSDFRSSERTYQLITQMSGRAGRADHPGVVVLQTYSPDHYVYKFAVENDYKGFYNKEINLREVTSFPPFTNIVRILVSGESEQETAADLKDIYDKILVLTKEYKGAFAYFAYMRAPLKRIKNQNRMQIILRLRHSFDEIIKKVYNISVPHKNVFVSVEVNPKNLS